MTLAAVSIFPTSFMQSDTTRAGNRFLIAHHNPDEPHQKESSHASQLVLRSILRRAQKALQQKAPGLSVGKKVYTDDGGVIIQSDIYD